MKNKLLKAIIVLLIMSVPVLAQTFEPSEHTVIKTDRKDGRYISSRGVMHAFLKNTQPTFSFNPNFTKEEMLTWQKDMSRAMIDLMKHPDIKNLPKPQKVGQVQRDGYRIEKWEAYPLPHCVVPYLVLIPNSVTGNQKAPAVICIPGTGESKEYAASEPELEPKYGPTIQKERYIMAVPFVKKGLIAVVIDNPGTAETSDLEKYTIAPNYQFDHVARILLELDWHYLGYSSYCAMHILNWMKEQPNIRKDRLIVCGFSLGTEPLMALGLMDPSIYAFVYNDFLCRTLERWVVLTTPNNDGIRVLPNSIMHLIPGFLTKFDFPDIVAALAPRPVICPEGGLDRDLEMVKKAFAIMGSPYNIETHHYPMFENVERSNCDSLPEGLDRATYFKLTNVDPPNHDMKWRWILPWLDKILRD